MNRLQKYSLKMNNKSLKSYIYNYYYLLYGVIVLKNIRNKTIIYIYIYIVS